MINHKIIYTGQVVYFCERTGYNYSYQIKVGIVDEFYYDKVAIKRLHIKDTRIVDGTTPYKDFVTPTKWQKLPKNWTYNTELFTITNIELEESEKKYRIDNPEHILEALNKGLIVYSECYDFSKLETEIDKNLGWRIIRKYDSNYDNERFRTLFDYDKLFSTYAEAKQWIDDYNAELSRQSNLSDVEWSLEQIEKVVNRAVAMNYLDDDVRKEKHDKLMDYFKSLKNIEDVEVRLYGVHCIQWKYWKNKKWNNINVEW